MHRQHLLGDAFRVLLEKPGQLVVHDCLEQEQVAVGKHHRLVAYLFSPVHSVMCQCPSFLRGFRLCQRQAELHRKRLNTSMAMWSLLPLSTVHYTDSDSWPVLQSTQATP